MAAFDDTDVFLTQIDLQRYGVPVKSATCLSIAEGCYVALSSLGAMITYTFDRAKLLLSITVAPAFLPKKTVQLGIARPTMTDNHVRETSSTIP